jgi:hypothetical protein
LIRETLSQNLSDNTSLLGEAALAMSIIAAGLFVAPAILSPKILRGDLPADGGSDKKLASDPSIEMNGISQEDTKLNQISARRMEGLAGTLLHSSIQRPGR